MFTNTNVGQCHSQLAIFNHLAVSGTRLSPAHTHLPLKGRGYSHLALSGCHHSRL